MKLILQESGKIDIELVDNASKNDLIQFLDLIAYHDLANSFYNIVGQPKSLLKKRNAARSSVIINSNILVKAENGKYYTEM
jgi:hypothetical protein